METLKELKRREVTIVAYTESMEFYTSYRFRKLELDEVVDYLYSPPDHKLPVLNVQAIRRYDPSHYRLSHTISRHTPEGELKPNPHILKTILSDLSVTADEAIYVGDSALKDVSMAQDAGVLDVYAAYGVAQKKPEYELIRRVTHWTSEMVERERAFLAKETVGASVVLNEGFWEILDLF